MGNRRRRWRLLGALLGSVVMVSGAPADEGDPGSSQTNLVKQANAPISSVLQIRLQDGYAPEFTDPHGRGNVFAIAATMMACVGSADGLARNGKKRRAPIGNTGLRRR